MNTDLARTVMRRIEALGQISEEPDKLTRTFCSPAMRRANDLVASWMREGGMEVREDAIGNLIGHYRGASPTSNSDKPRSIARASRAGVQSLKPAREPGAKVLLLGSHLDTVRDAGKFDGALGVLVAIACVHRLFESKTRLPVAIEVIGFADEEGVRYHSAYLGSKVLTGKLKAEDLKRIDAEGVTMAEAIGNFGGNPDALRRAQRAPNGLIGYVEVHIEQGPVLEQKNVPVGIVTAIAGQTRTTLVFTGRAGHAGTTPMKLRRDAACAAAEFVLAVESLAQRRDGLVATVGEIAVLPGASNVIPGEVRLTLDLRHSQDRARRAAMATLKLQAAKIARRRKVRLGWQHVQETCGVECDQRLSGLLSEAVKRHTRKPVSLPSGAGHDAAAMAAITPVSMLFVRCKGGISHHPAESASVGDVKVAIEVMDDFLQALAGMHPFYAENQRRLPSAATDV